MYVGIAALQSGGHHAGQVVLAFQRVHRQVLLQKGHKPGLGLGHVTGGEAPQIHRDDRVGGQVGPVFAAIFGVVDAAVVRLDAGALGHADQVAVLIGHADAAADTAVGADRVAQQKAHHAPRIAVAVGVAAQVVVHQLKALRAVVVVGVDDRKRCAADGLLGSQDGMGSAPGLHAAIGHGKAFGQAVQLLVGIAHLKPGLQSAGTHGGLERLLDLVLDDKDDGLKSGAAGIVQAVVDDGLPAGTDRVDLLQPAVAAAHTGSHNDKNRFFAHGKNLLYTKSFRLL